MSKNIKYLMCRELEQHILLCTSKRTVRRKQAAKTGVYTTATPYIHSYNTIYTYMQHARAYGDWLNARGEGHCSMIRARELAAEYILQFQSVPTQKTVRAALAKVFGCTGPDLVECGPRRAADIKRGRNLTQRAAAFERNHPDLAEMCRSVGPRLSELKVLRLGQFYLDGDDLYCRIKGKGGRIRDSLVLPGRGRDLILAEIAARGSDPDALLACCHLSSNINVHRWRADYAARCYAYAVAHGCNSGPEYICRNGSSRRWYKSALDFVSTNLGHGPHRYSTIVYNYLSYGDATR